MDTVGEPSFGLGHARLRRAWNPRYIHNFMEQSVHGQFVLLNLSNVSASFLPSRSIFAFLLVVSFFNFDFVVQEFHFLKTAAGRGLFDLL